MALLLGFHSQPLMLVQGWCNSCSSNNRAFSCDVMLSSNMAASIATEINIHLCKHLLLCITVSPWTSPFVVQAHDDYVRAWLPWISRSVCTIQLPCWRTAWRQWKRAIAPAYLPTVPIYNFQKRQKIGTSRFFFIDFLFLFFLRLISEKKGGNRHRPCLDLQYINFKYENCVSLAFKIAKSPWPPPRALPLDPRPLGVQILNIQMLAGMLWHDISIDKETEWEFSLGFGFRVG